MIPVYDYYGLMVSFKNEASLPIIVCGNRETRESRIVIRFNKGLMETPKWLRSDNELDEEDRKILILLVERNISEIIKLWLDIFLYNKAVEPEIIKYNIRNSKS